MWYVLGVAALVAVIVAAVSVLRRPSAEDLSSVRHYHSALGTLEHLSERSPRPGPDDGPPGDEGAGGGDGQPRFYRRPDAPGPLPAGVGPGDQDEPLPRLSPRSSGRVPPAAVRVEPPGSPLVFDDARPRDRYESGHTATMPRSRVDRVQRHALESMNHRPRRGVAITAVAVVAVVLFAVLALVGSQHSHRHSTAGTTPTTTIGHTSASSKPPARRHQTTSTTAPAQLVALSSTSSTAVYTVGAPSFHLNLSTSGPCWVNATAASTGSTLWTGTMQAGGSQDIPATGATHLELGTLAVAVTVDGVPVVIPSTIHSPFVLTFEPASASPGPGSSSTTTPPFG